MDMAAPPGHTRWLRFVRLVVSVVSGGVMAFVLATVVFDFAFAPRLALSPDEVAEIMKVRWPPRASGLRVITERNGAPAGCVLARFYLPTGDVAPFLASSPFAGQLSATQRPEKLLKMRPDGIPWWTPGAAHRFAAAALEATSPPGDYTAFLVDLDGVELATVFLAHCGE